MIDPIDIPKPLHDLRNTYVRQNKWDTFKIYLEKQSLEILNRWEHIYRTRKDFIDKYVHGQIKIPKKPTYQTKEFDAILESDEADYYNAIRDWYIEIQKEFNSQLNIYNRCSNSLTNPTSVLKSKLKEQSYDISDQEAEACVAALDYTQYKKNTLLYMKFINRFSRDNNIRVEDVQDLLKEYITG
jgi:hypothetical protein